MRRLRELWRYGLVGLVNVMTYIALYSLLVLVGVPYVLAAVLSFPLPVALGYWLHEHWTFGRAQPTVRGLAGYLAIQVAALVLGIAVLVLLVDGLGLQPIPARIVATPIVPAFTYAASSLWIFRRDGVSAGVTES